jgi:hypothetical protein
MTNPLNLWVRPGSGRGIERSSGESLSNEDAGVCGGSRRSKEGRVRCKAGFTRSNARRQSESAVSMFPTGTETNFTQGRKAGLY